VAILALTCASAARAEPVQVGGFVGMDFLPGDVELGNSWAPDQVPGSGPSLGGRATYWMLPYLGVEGELQVAATSTSSNTMAGRSSYASPIVGAGVHLIAALENDSPVTPHAVVGGGVNALFTSSPFARDDADPVAYWGLGVAWAITDDLSLRVDVRHGIEAGRMDDVTSTFAAEVGLSTRFGAHASVRPTPEPEPPGSDDHTDVVVTPPPPPPPPADTDGDGLPDRADKCPAEPEDKDGFADDDGCPDPDNDGDGFADASDRCPNEPETKNGFQDTDGCPDEIAPAVAALLGPADAVTFDRNKSRLKPAAKKSLDAIASTLRKAKVKIVIEGHAGKGVSDDLARRRAEAVKWYLIDAGLAADTIDTRAVPADAGPARIELQLAP